MTFKPELHDRSAAGTFVEMTHSNPEFALAAGEVICTLCEQTRGRGVIHRCAAPDLIELSEATQKVLAACRAAGGRPLIVGGSVRDALISRAAGVRTAPKDIDIEVYGLSDFDSLYKPLNEIGWVQQLGSNFGILKAEVDEEDFDIALPRTEKKTGDGHRGFETTPDPNLDEVAACARRDFTVNAMAWDPETQELVDPWGGTADLEAGILRHPTEAFAEDPLRVLRGAGFASRFGLTMAPETAELSRSIVSRFSEIPTERVWGAWRKIVLLGTDMTSALNVLRDTGWLQHFPQLADTVGCEQDPGWHPEGDVFVHIGLAADEATTNAIRDQLSDEDREVAVFGALVHDLGKPISTKVLVDEDGVSRISSAGHAETGVEVARSFLASIGAPNDLIGRVLPLVAEHMCHTSGHGAEPSGPAVRRLIRRLSANNSGATIVDWARVVDADCAGRGAGAKESPSAAWIAVAERVGPTPQKPFLRGDHLFAAGWKASTAFRAVIDASIGAQDDGIIVDEETAVAWLREHGERIRDEAPVHVAETKDERKVRLRAAKAARREAAAAV